MCPEDLAEACLTVMRAQTTICRSRETPPWCQAAKEASSVESLPFSSYGTTLRTWTGAFLLLPRPFSWMIESSAAKPWLLLEALTRASPCHHRPSKSMYCSSFYFCKPELLRFTLGSVNWCILVYTGGGQSATAGAELGKWSFRG